MLPDHFHGLVITSYSIHYTKLYEDNEDGSHAITSINQADLQKVLDYTAYVMTSPYKLENDFAYNFLPGVHENGPEALFV